MKAGTVVGELAFVNDYSGLVVSPQYCGDDFIERNDFGFDFRGEQLERKIGGRQLAGNSNFLICDLFKRVRSE